MIQTLNVPVATAAFDHLSSDRRTRATVFQVRDFDCDVLLLEEETTENSPHAANRSHDKHLNELKRGEKVSPAVIEKCIPAATMCTELKKKLSMVWN